MVEAPFPDYYAILQVHPEAEVEVIRAAYRMLMRKYHPDNLSPEQRQDLGLIQRVQMINSAYDVLSDADQRAAYDLAIRQQKEKPSVLSTPGVETRIHLVRCAKTDQTYQMLLARRAGSGGLFRVTGFELVEKKLSGRLPGAQSGPHLLADEQKKSNPLSALLKKVLPGSKPPVFTDPPPKFPAQSELKELFAASDSLSFGEIDWAGHTCPACRLEFTFTDAGTATWCHCVSCSRIFCAGNLRQTPLGVVGRCPWCGKIVKITRRIHLGESMDLPVRGEVGRSAGELPRIKDATHKQLPKKKDEV